jgi:hypothetical protein
MAKTRPPQTSTETLRKYAQAGASAAIDKTTKKSPESKSCFRSSLEPDEKPFARLGNVPV